MSLSEQAADAVIMYRRDRVRAFFCGMMEAGFLTFAIPICIRCFSAPEWVKAALASAGFLGLMFTPVTVALASRVRLSVSQLWATYLCAAGAILLIGAFVPGLTAFALSLGLAYLIYSQQIPLITHLYAEHYPSGQQGGRVSTSLGILALSGIVFAQAGGWLLDRELDNYRLIPAGMALCAFLAAVAVARIPSRPLNRKISGNIWKNVSLIWRDRLFGWMVLSWFLVGFAMLMCHPLRQEYVANEAYGIYLDNRQVAWVVFILPALSHIASVKLWGWLYEQMNFVVLRVMINLMLIFFLLVYFNTQNFIWLAISASVMGFALGGGKLAWSLWVTRIATPERVSSYMSVHTAMAGVRGVIAPFVGYALLSSVGLSVTAAIAAFSITLSAIFFACVRTHPRISKQRRTE